MSPNKPSILKASTGKILQLGSKMGAYIFLSETFEKPSLGMVSFEVRSWPNSDARSGELTFPLPHSQAKGMNDILTCFHTEERLCVGHEGREDTAAAYEVRVLESDMCLPFQC